MHFKTLAIAAIVANFYVLTPVEAQTLYNSNSSSSGGSSAATPVFIETPKPAAQPANPNLYTNAGSKSAAPQAAQPKTTPMSDSEYAAYAASVERQNASVGSERSAQVNANFQQVAQQNAQEAAARKAAQAQGGGKGTSGGGQAQQADPYAGHTVVFTGGKKADEEKPTRLFNVQ